MAYSNSNLYFLSINYILYVPPKTEPEAAKVVNNVKKKTKKVNKTRGYSLKKARQISLSADNLAQIRTDEYTRARNNLNTIPIGESNITPIHQTLNLSTVELNQQD
jgi:hypothetical protein